MWVIFSQMSLNSDTSKSGRRKTSALSFESFHKRVLDKVEMGERKKTPDAIVAQQLN